jgi:hypothetical protein
VAGTNLIIASAATTQDGQALSIDESKVVENNDVRSNVYVRVDSTYSLGTYDGVSWMGSYQSGLMPMGSEVVNNTHLFGYSSCQVLGACSHRNLPGSACQGGPNNGFCYEAANAVVQAPLWASSTGLTPRTRLTCGRLIETFDHFGPGVNPPIHVDATARSCPRGTPGGATGRIHTVKRFLYAGCMLSSDAKYEPAAEVHVPAMCAVPQHWRQGCLFPGALNYMPGAKESGRCYYKTVGCMDSTAINYNSEATDSDGSCIAKVLGCTVGPGQYSGVDPRTPGFESTFHDDPGRTDGGGGRVVLAGNRRYPAMTTYNEAANVMSGCVVAIEGCMDSTAANYDPLATVSTLSWCVPSVRGCMDPLAYNYSPMTTIHNQTLCSYQGGCMDRSAINYDPKASAAGPCYFFRSGCLDPAALNFRCSAYALTPCSVAPALSVTVHSAVVCTMSAASAVVAASVSDLLALSAANPSAGGTADQIEVVISVVVKRPPCEMAADTTMLSRMAAAVRARRARVSNTPPSCSGRRLQAGSGEDNAMIGFVFVFAASEAAAASAALTDPNGGAFANTASLQAALASVPGLPEIPVQVFTQTVRYYVPEPPAESGWAAGPIVGIVIAALAGTTVIAGLAYLMLKRKTTTAEIVPA